MTTDDKPPPDVAAEAHMVVGDADYLAKLNAADRRVVARAEFSTSDGSDCTYTLVRFPTAATWARRGDYMPPTDWHVYEADEPWDELDFTKSVREWVGVIDERSDPHTVRHQWLSVILAFLAVAEVIGDKVAGEPEPFVGVYLIPTGPLTAPSLAVVFKFANNGRTVFASEVPVTFLPGAEEFHAAWSAPAVSIRAAKQQWL